MTKAFAAFFQNLLGLRRARSYRPERHYMRGPGPKCGAA